MTTTTLLGLPLLDASQSQKHVTHNQAIMMLDGFIHLAVISRGVTSPPASVNEGDRYLIGNAPTGIFLQSANQIAMWQSGAWTFLAPQIGWRVYVANENRMLVFGASGWGDLPVAVSNLQNLTGLGIGTSSDSKNLLALKANAALLTAQSPSESGSGDLRVSLNKTALGNTVSQIYQTNYSGRAEVGLTGDDHFHVKVSADGAAWREAINIDPASGSVSFPSGAVGLSLAPATAVALGGIKVGAGLSVAADGTLSGSGSYSLTPATTSALGGIKVGAGLSVAADGTLSGSAPYSLTPATATALGGIKVGTNLSVAADGTLSGVVTAPLLSFRNRIINGNFAINQRGYVSGAASSVANQYCLDRWRIVTAGQGCSFVASGIDAVVTAPAGGLEQVIEGVNIEGGAYTLSWSGTAAALVNGVAVANGSGVTLPAGTNATVRFSSGTMTRVQLEPGSTATSFERRDDELRRCQRYYWQSIPANAFSLQNYIGTAGAWIGVTLQHPVLMRAAPTMSGSLSLNGPISNATFGYVNQQLFGIAALSTGTGGWSISNTTPITANAEL